MEPVKNTEDWLDRIHMSLKGEEFLFRKIVYISNSWELYVGIFRSAVLPLILKGMELIW